MNINDITSNATISKLLSMKGQFVRLRFARPLKVKKGNAPVMKETVMLARVGVSYDNLASVQAKREDGTLPEVNQGLPWGEWLAGHEGYLLTHKDQLYFRFYPATNASNGGRTVTFSRGGQTITKEDAQSVALASEFAEKDSLDTFSLKVESLLEVSGVAV